MAISQDWQCNKRLVECLGHMFDTSTCTDVTFLVGGAKEVVHAHKLILISRSPVFYAMFEGPLSEKGEVTVPDIDKTIFEQFVRYLYTDDVTLTCDNVTYLLYAAKKYCVDLLTQECREFMKTSLNPENACTLLEHAHLCAEDQLATDCRKLIFENPKIVLTTPGFQNLCSACVLSITDSDDLMTSEDEVYRAVMKWSESECGRQKLDINDANKRQVLGDIIFTIRFPLMSEDVFKKEVLFCDILSSDEMIEIERTRQKHDYKGKLMFKSSPRKTFVSMCTKIERVIRCSYLKGSSHNWNQGDACDAISFSLSKSASFHGIGVFGVYSGNVVYDISLTLCDEDNTDLCNFTDKINTDQTADIFDIKLDRSIPLKKSTVYTIAMTMTGPIAKKGTNGIKNVSVGGIDVTFTDSEKSTNGTVVSQGQIPCLLLSVC